MQSVQRNSFKVGGKPEKKATYNPLDPAVLALELEDDEEHRRNLRIGIAVAVVLHVLLLIISLPERPLKLEASGRKHQAYIMQQVRFKPPQAKPKQEIKQKKAKKIPIPDPTPDDPEPLIHEVEAPEIPDEFEGIEGALYIPDTGPPGPGSEAVAVGGDISAPVKIFSPQPQYTEDARQARVQGVVILRTVVDTAGDVVNVKILKGLPGGLTESAMATVSRWKFEPARQQGQPVAVYFLLTISFSLQ